MQPDDDSKTTLTKWPFFMGDLLLVSTAIVIAIASNWQLSDWQVAYCVIAVALGAGLFVLPYIVEYRVRVSEEAEDRAGDLRLLGRDVESTIQGIDVLDARVRALESVAADQITEVESEARDPALGDRLEAMEARLAQIEQSKAQDLVDGIDEATPDEDVSVPRTPTRAKRPNVVRQKREPRKRVRPVEPRLLKRAINEQQDGSASAVVRIIQSQPKVVPAESSEPKPKEPDSLESGEAPNLAKKAAKKKSKLRVKKVAKKAAKPAEKPSEKLSVEVVEEKPEETKKTAPALGSDVKGSEAMLGGLLFDEDPVPAVPKRRRARKKDAQVTASVFIGIGNKPYLRGSGAGLNWETGVVMDFVEIGKWSWIPAESFEGAIEVQVYRNDEDADSLGKFTLEPAQKLDLWPVF